MSAPQEAPVVIRRVLWVFNGFCPIDCGHAPDGGPVMGNLPQSMRSKYSLNGIATILPGVMEQVETGKPSTVDLEINVNHGIALSKGAQQQGHWAPRVTLRVGHSTLLKLVHKAGSPNLTQAFVPQGSPMTLMPETLKSQNKLGLQIGSLEQHASERLAPSVENDGTGVSRVP